MKLILIPIAAAALAYSCVGPAYVAKSDAETAYVRGGVRQIRETLFDNPADATSLPDTLGEFDTFTVVDYNRAGNITLVESFRGPERLQFVKDEYLYDSSGESLQRSVSHNLPRRGATTILYDYDSAGRRTSEVESNGFYRFDFTYGRSGYPRTQTTDDVDTGERLTIARYVYDRHGRLKRLKGERRERYRYHPDGSIAEVRTRRSAVDLYDSYGNLEAMTVRVDRKRRAEGRTFERFSVTLSAEYEYDERGNWIRRVMSYQGQVQSVALREIDYYDTAEGATR